MDMIVQICNKEIRKRLRCLHEIAIFIHCGQIPYFGSCDIVLPGFMFCLPFDHNTHVIYSMRWNIKGRRFAFVWKKMLLPFAFCFNAYNYVEHCVASYLKLFMWSIFRSKYTDNDLQDRNETLLYLIYFEPLFVIILTKNINCCLKYSPFHHLNQSYKVF